MWRRYGERTYATLTLAVFTVQAVALVALTWAFTFDRLNIGPQGFVMREALGLAVSVTALAVMVLTAYTLAYQAVSNGRLIKQKIEAKLWRDRWLRVLFQDEPRPSGRLSEPAVEALVEVREKLIGSDAERLDSIIEGQGITHDLLSIATNARRYSLARRLDALDLLARAGSARGFEPLGTLTNDPEMAVRVMAVRAFARSIASLNDPQARESAALVLVDLLGKANVPAGAVEEAFLVLGPAASDALGVTLKSSDRPDLIAAALDAAGRLHCADLGSEIARHLSSEDANVRCAAWRAIDGTGKLPEGLAEQLSEALDDPAPHVRGQAVRVARLLPAAQAIKRLTGLLADPSWWVRRATAKSLADMGEAGLTALRTAGESHPDRFARHIALDVLVEMNQLRPERGLHLRAAS